MQKLDDRALVISPVFDDDAVVLAFAANDHYVPYLSALLQSVMEAADGQRNYDIVVLSTDISDRHQRVLARQLGAPWMSLRFFDASTLGVEGEDLFLRGHFRIETYYRLALQDIMPAYHKVLYLDSDLIVLKDVAALYDVPLGDCLVAAVRDPDTAGLYNGYLPNKRDYMDNVLKMSDPYAYFQAGVMLFNLDAFRETYTVPELFAYASSHEWELLDQDVLNHFCEGRVKYVDMSWNVMMDMQGIRANGIIALAPDYLRADYAEAREHPAIVHYAGPEKPWLFPACDFSEAFWSFARKTPFYEVALQRMCTDCMVRELRREQQQEAQARALEEQEWRDLGAAGRMKERLYRTSMSVFPEGTARRKAFDGARRRVKGAKGVKDSKDAGDVEDAKGVKGLKGLKGLKGVKGLKDLKGKRGRR